MKKLYLMFSFIVSFSLLLNACNSGNPTPIQGLTVSSISGNNTFTANVGESAVITYQLLLRANPQGYRYTANISLPNNQFSIESNECVNFYGANRCNIAVKFSPADQSSFSSNNVFNFSVGALSSSITVITRPQSMNYENKSNY